MKRNQDRCALVTGASSGIGEAIAQRLAADGIRVFGTSRTLSNAANDAIERVALDVTSDDSVAAAIDTVLDRAGRLDVVVNNAGSTMVGAIEETSTDEARRLIDTNLLGIHRVTRATLPHLRASKGHAIIMGSVAGFLSKPAAGLYSATKHALEGYAGTLRLEMFPFGVRVALVEPGFVRTNIAANAHVTSAHPAYESWRRALANTLARDVGGGIDPADVAACVSHIVASDAPKFRHLVGRDAVRIRILSRVLPQAMIERALRKRFGLHRQSGEQEM